MDQDKRSIMMRGFLTVFAALTICSSLAHAIPESAAQVIQINQPIINFVEKNSSEGLLSFEIMNQGRRPHSLVSVSSPAAKQARLDQDSPGKHGYQLEAVTLNPKTTYKFAPQSSVVRLQELKPHHTQSGGLIPVTLGFDDGSQVQVSARVQAIN
jgi:copper(I)-binding protein